MPRFPPAAILLVNPRVPLSTADVFRALQALPLAGAPPEPRAPSFRGVDDLIGALERTTNHLEPVARALCPPINAVLAALGDLPAARLVRMSGSGPTCFALFADLEEAEAARIAVLARRPEWWAAAGVLG